ncbi:hypothetical protein PP175_25690 (plasmid) [Aneurinibacillus sp. Ricciae_BoGa-3]|uniref:hypothetical protein n=1 Tax=Aneurinibacillus sp. Ricciae_BoGa-3 TaxID=3022697 RepID=UPI00233FABA8|nr:hypothetical protein [Aneurinibacillus sp. Ricciae_BoGa-3]WCK57462.1 hypothetical protein PP175_25690 [Aneurinibacillus sp. Ricciae_BoGa-3]
MVYHWLEQFPFLTERDITKSYFFNKNDEISGNLYIDIDKEYAPLIEEKEKDLPKELHLNVRIRSDKESQWVHQVRKWVNDLNGIEISTIEEWTHYDENQENQGNIYIVTEPKNFDKIQELAKSLPKNIHFSLCTHREFLHSLWIAYTREYLDKNNPGEYRMFKTA